MRIVRATVMALCLWGAANAQSGAPPAGAQQVAADTYKYTDKEGVVWIYRKKPFGWAKVKEADEKAAAEAPKSEAKPVNQPVIRVVAVKGDTVNFETPSAFGKRVWSNRKGELTADEKKALEAWDSAQAAKQKK